MSNYSPSTQTKNTAVARMDYIDVLRAGACLWVLLRHSIDFGPMGFSSSSSVMSFFVSVAQVGWLGVSLFLVLSGFCLYYPLVRRADPSQIRLDIKSFAIRRARRLLPPYYAALIVAILALYLTSHSLQDILGLKKHLLLHILMLHNLRASTFGSIITPAWSLALEWQLYIVFPLLVVLAARGGLKMILIVTFIIAVVWQSMVFSKFGFSLLWTPGLAVYYHALPGRVFEFAAGMTAAALVARPRAGMVRVCLITLCLLIIPATWFVLKVSMFGPLIDQIWGVIFCCIIILCNQIPYENFQRRPILKFATWMGTISYSIYLIHSIIFEHVPIPDTPDSTRVLLILIRIVVTIAVSYLFFWLFERPFLSRRKNPTTAELAQASALSPAP